MRILTLSYEFPPIGGGGAQVVAGLAREITRLGHTVDVVTMGFADLPSEEVFDGIRVTRVASRRASKSRCTPVEAATYLAKAYPLLRHRVADRSYDLIHSHFIFPDGLLARILSQRSGVPYLLTAHGSDVPGYNDKLFFRLVHPILSSVWRSITRRAAAVVSPSRVLASLIERARPGTSLVVVPNGFDPARFEKREKSDRVLVATRLVERKGVQHVLRAAADLDDGFELVVVGDGEYAAELRRLNESLGMPARFVGWLDNGSKELRELLETSAIYVLPSDYENFPVCLLEAMATGSAIITTQGHGCEEVVGDAAELVTPASIDESACVTEIARALRRLTSDAVHRADLGERARRRLEDQFAWSTISRRYADLYEKHSRTAVGD
jgi:glycosyltransferase involved in cell wall biosynthesis